MMEHYEMARDEFVLKEAERVSWLLYVRARNQLTRCRFHSLH